MSSQPTGLAAALPPSTPQSREEFRQEAFQALSGRFGATLDPRDRWGLTAVVAASRLREAVQFLRDGEFGLDFLVDVTAIDYLGFPGHDEPRFAVVWNFKSMRFPARRLRLKVWVEEESPRVPSIHDLYAIANWQERETWDQYGIVFEGHPDLRRLLNHVEFQGHPLRKDYPARKRQWLSTNDPLVEPLQARLRANGFELLDTPESNSPSIEETGILARSAEIVANNVGRAP